MPASFSRFGRQLCGYTFQTLALAVLLFGQPLAHAWTLTCLNGANWSLNGGPTSSGRLSVHIPNLTTAPFTRIYFCIERPLNSLNNETVTANLVSASSASSSTWSGKQIGEWQKVPGTTDVCTFNGQSSQTWPTYVPMNPSAPYGPREYKVGYRVYGYVQGGGFSSGHQYLSLDVSSLSGGWMRITISDQDLQVAQEPDVSALPVNNTLGDPAITVNSVADKTSATSPASYTLAWDQASASSFKVTGGTGAGGIAAAGITTGNSRAFTSVSDSVQTYTLATSGPAAIAWKLNANVPWEIHRNGVALTGTGTSGTTANPSLSVSTVGTYHLRVNGLDKKAEDEVINLTRGFLQRSKTVQLTITSP